MFLLDLIMCDAFMGLEICVYVGANLHEYTNTMCVHTQACISVLFVCMPGAAWSSCVSLIFTLAPSGAGVSRVNHLLLSTTQSQGASH